MAIVENNALFGSYFDELANRMRGNPRAFRDFYLQEFKPYMETDEMVNEGTQVSESVSATILKPFYDKTGAPVNGSDIDLTRFSQAHIKAALSRATAVDTPENRRIVAYTIGLSVDLMVRYMNMHDPKQDTPEVIEFRYLLAQFAEWLGLEEFDPWRK